MTHWPPLRDALARARAANVALPIWWRDDDVIAPTSPLDQLHTLSDRLKLPVHLAAIPAHTEASLVPYIAARPNLIPMVHGWAHENHAAPGQKKSEFPQADVAARARAQDGLERLVALFGTTLLPAFVPPWNRMDAKLANHFNKIGYKAISGFGPRTTNATDVPRINTHIDPIFWRGDRGLVSPDLLIQHAVERITARIEGREDATEPLGYLTHHLVHTEEIWQFSERLLNDLLEGGADIANLRKDLA